VMFPHTPANLRAPHVCLDELRDEELVAVGASLASHLVITWRLELQSRTYASYCSPLWCFASIFSIIPRQIG